MRKRIITFSLSGRWVNNTEDGTRFTHIVDEIQVPHTDIPPHFRISISGSCPILSRHPSAGSCSTALFFPPNKPSRLPRNVSQAAWCIAGCMSSIVWIWILPEIGENVYLEFLSVSISHYRWIETMWTFLHHPLSMRSTNTHGSLNSYAYEQVAFSFAWFGSWDFL